MKFSAILLFTLILLTKGECGFSQITIPSTEKAPLIDGNVNEPIWESGALINEFYQREPDEGQPLSEKTEVYILFDSDNIYFGLKCYQDPKSIAAKEMLRGAPLPFDDRVHIILDTYHDGRNAFLFEINPLGSVGDAYISQNGRQMNHSWEGLFIGKSSITAFGWEAELAIPFKTLSFDKNNSNWGLFMNRMIESKQEWGSWPVANINAAECAVSDAGIITGLKGLSQGIGLDIVPYVLTGVDSKRGEDSKLRINGGTDLYYQVTPSLKASMSFNTDFAEIEADARQINLSRFDIRLNEKRNFFLDGADIFRYGMEGRRTEPPSGKMNPFFSRRIGLDSAGASIPIIYAGKLTGRVNKWNIGMLHVNEYQKPNNSNSTAARVSYNLGDLSSVGMIATHGNSISDQQNLVTGLDLNLATSKFRGNRTVSLIMYGIKSTTENIKGRDAAWGLLFTYPNDLIDFEMGHQQIGQNFFTGLGFVPRTGIRETWGNLSIGPRINKLGLRQISFGGSFDYVTDFSGRIQSQSLSFEPAEIRFASAERFKYSLSLISENLDREFSIYSDYIIPANNYQWWENEFSFNTSGSRDIFGALKYTFGDFFTGRKNSIGVRLNWKVLVPIYIGGSLTVDKVSLPEGDFRAEIFQINLNILFSPDISLYNYLQYDSQTETFGLQTRFRWVLKPGNEILLVWNSGYSIPGEYYIMHESAARFKLKYNFRF